MQVCKTVKLRMRDRRNGTKSLFLDFWPGYRDPETMELIRRRSLGMYIYADPANKQQKLYNDKILAKAEAIRCKVYIDVLDEKYDFFNRDRLKEDFLGYFRNMVNRNYVKCDAAYKHFEKFSKGKCTFEMLDVLYCNKYMEYLLDTKVSSRGGHVIKKSISRNTASAYWNVFKQVLTKAYRERRLTDDLASLLENISCTTPVKQSLTLEEVRRMYATECSIPVVRKAALFSCLTGLRISDILRLKWENIRSYADGGYYLDFICVKTKCQTQVPIGDDAYALIHPKTNRTYIFQGFKRTMTYGVMQSWLKECGIEKHITFHCFRHTYASLCGAINVCVSAMIGDCLDYMEWKTGRRLTGMGSAVSSFVNKFGNAISTSFIILMYIIVDFDISAINSNVTANPLEMAHSVRQGMFSIVSLIPAISLLVCIIPMFFYNLTGDFKDKIESELAQQREAKGITISK